MTPDSTESRKEFLQLYFRAPKEAEWHGIGLLATAVLLLLFGSWIVKRFGDLGWISYGCAGLLLVPGLGLAVLVLVRIIWASRRRSRMRATENQHDQIVQELFRQDLDRVENLALDRFGLDEQLETGNERIHQRLTVSSPLLWPVETLDEEYELIRINKEGAIVCGAHHVASLFVTKERICILICHLNFFSGEILRARIRELRHGDISFIETVEESRQLETSLIQKRVNVREVVIGTRSHESIRLPIEIPELFELAGKGPPGEEAEKTVRNLRVMLRDN